MSVDAFFGRVEELKDLRSFEQSSSSRLTAVYGRRRVGKTRLIKEAYKNFSILHFEGLEGDSSAAQRKHFIKSLYRQTKESAHKLVASGDWEDLLILLSEYIGNRKTVLFFDEFQWMAAGRTELISKLKFVWDNYFQKQQVHLILCGSISSFLVKKVIRSQALYGRISRIIHLQPLSFQDIREGFFNSRCTREALECYLTMGGIPEYVRLFDPGRSVRLNLGELCFKPDSWFLDEYNRLFISHFGRKGHYRKIVEVLSQKKFASREQIASALGLKTGGRVSEFLDDLVLAGFIEQYSPVQLKGNSHLRRYRIADFFLRFYLNFVAPAATIIQKTGKELELHKALPDRRFEAFLGFAFEYFCYREASLVARKCGFWAVSYDFGPFFIRKDLHTGAQVDLLFKRSDNVLTVCECKFARNVGMEVVDETERKIKALSVFKNHSFEKVLITVYPPSTEVLHAGYFTRVLTLDNLYEKE